MSNKTSKKNQNQNKDNEIVQAIMILFTDFLAKQVASEDETKKTVEVEDLTDAIKRADITKFHELIGALKKNIPRGQRAKKLIDPDAAKKPQSAYLLFCADNRDLVKKENPEMSAQEIMAELGSMWKNLSAKSKEKYNKIYAKNKATYDKTMAGYVRPSDEDLAALEVNKPKRTRSSKPKKEKNGPEKKAMSAYMCFCRDKRPGLVKKNPEMTFADIGRALGEMWKETPEDKRKKWLAEAAADKIRYQKELDEMIANGEAEDPKKAKKTKSKSDETPKKTKSKSKSDDDEADEAPKKSKKTDTKKDTKKSKSKPTEDEPEDEPEEEPVEEAPKKSKKTDAKAAKPAAKDAKKTDAKPAAKSAKKTETKPADKKSKAPVKVEMTMGKAKKVVVSSNQDDEDVDDLFADEE